MNSESINQLTTVTTLCHPLTDPSRDLGFWLPRPADADTINSFLSRYHEELDKYKRMNEKWVQHLPDSMTAEDEVEVQQQQVDQDVWIDAQKSWAKNTDDKVKAFFEPIKIDSNSVRYANFDISEPIYNVRATVKHQEKIINYLRAKWLEEVMISTSCVRLSASIAVALDTSPESTMVSGEDAHALTPQADIRKVLEQYSTFEDPKPHFDHVLKTSRQNPKQFTSNFVEEGCEIFRNINGMCQEILTLVEAYYTRSYMTLHEGLEAPSIEDAMELTRKRHVYNSVKSSSLGEVAVDPLLPAYHDWADVKWKSKAGGEPPDVASSPSTSG